jgi:hypothetical protein
LYKLGELASTRGEQPLSPSKNYTSYPFRPGGRGLQFLLIYLDPNAIDELLAERDELVHENAALRQENQHLADLLKDYEKGIETTTQLIRDHAVSVPLQNTPHPLYTPSNFFFGGYSTKNPLPGPSYIKTTTKNSPSNNSKTNACDNPLSNPRPDSLK